MNATNEEIRQAAINLIRDPDRVQYGAAPRGSVEDYGYYLDGRYAGPDLGSALDAEILRIREERNRM